MLPDIHRATQKFYIFLIVYLTGCTPLCCATQDFSFERAMVIPLYFALSRRISPLQDAR